MIMLADSESIAKLLIIVIHRKAGAVRGVGTSEILKHELARAVLLESVGSTRYLDSLAGAKAVNLSPKSSSRLASAIGPLLAMASEIVGDKSVRTYRAGRSIGVQHSNG